MILAEQRKKLGAVETWKHAKRAPTFPQANRDQIEGVLVTLPNFGDEKGVADTLKLPGLNVPVLVQAYPDDLDQFTVERRRDAFCGKVSVCNNLRQYGHPVLADHAAHRVPPIPGFRLRPEVFSRSAGWSTACAALRLGAVGARPERLQHHALQRETAAGVTASASRPGSFGGVRQRPAELSDDDRGEGKDRRDPRLCR